ncbi:17334_t:CDS:1, partial [Dentiscutata heterogama]
YKDLYLDESDNIILIIPVIYSDSDISNRHILPNQSDQSIIFNQFKQLSQIRKVSKSKTSTKKFLQDRIYYGKSYGLLQTALTLAMETETSAELDQLCYQFINQKKELQKANSKTSDNYNNQENTIQITNPIVITPRGCPSKRQKSILELNDKQPLSTINESLNQSNHEQLNIEENPKQNYT